MDGIIDGYLFVNVHGKKCKKGCPMIKHINLPNTKSDNWYVKVSVVYSRLAAVLQGFR